MGDPGLNGRIILMDIQEVECEVMYLIELVQNRDR